MLLPCSKCGEEGILRGKHIGDVRCLSCASDEGLVFTDSFCECIWSLVTGNKLQDCGKHIRDTSPIGE